MFFLLQKQVERPYVVYADSECSLLPSEEQGILHNQGPNSTSFYVVDTFNTEHNYDWEYVGKYCVS